MDLNHILQLKIVEAGGYILTVAMLLGLLIVWALTWFVLRVTRRLINRGLLRAAGDEGRRHSLYLIAKYLVWIAAVTAMLEIAGVKITVLLAGSAALLVGISLGIQQIFRDIVSGIFLLFEGTIEIGDMLQVDGTVGKVEEIRLRTSKLKTRDGAVMVVPNNKFITENVYNWSDPVDEPTRFSVIVLTGHAADEKVVRELLLACAHEHPDVLKDNPKRQPQARLHEFRERSLSFEILFWTARKFEVDNVKSDLRYAARERFRAHDVPPPKED